MSYEFDATAPVTNTATTVAFTITGGSASGAQLRFHGSGMSYTPGTGAWTGTVTSIDIYDAARNQVLVTVAVDAAQQALVTGNATAMLTASIDIKSDIGSWFTGVDDLVPHFNALGTEIILDQLDINGAIIGKVRFAGNGFDQRTTAGTVTSIERLDAAGNSLIPPQVVDYSAAPVLAKYVYYTLGMSEALYHEFVVGNDTVTATDNNGVFMEALLDGGAGNDSYTGGALGGFISYNFATSGVTVNLSNPLAGTATGGGGNDTIVNIGGIEGSRFNDVITGADSPGTSGHLMGNEGDDIINGGTQNELISGESSNSDDQVAGNDTLDGGGGTDTLDLRMATGAVVLSLSATGGGAVTAAGIGTDTFNNFENVWGGSGADQITGNSGNNLISGFAGNDTLDGGGGVDMLDLSVATGGITLTLSATGGGVVTAAGIDTDTFNNFEGVWGGFGSDTLIGNNADNVLNGNSGNDTLNGNGGTDALNGGQGSDFLYFDELDSIHGGNDYDYAFALTSNGVNVNLVVAELENVSGGAGNDVLNAGGSTVSVVLNGGAGADQLFGGNVDDTFNIDAADTVLQGGSGTDFAWAVTDTAGVTINMVSQSIEIAWGGSGNDTFNAAGAAFAVQIDGKDGNDILTGGNANNILIGNGGADQITGGATGDQLFFDQLDTVVNGGGGFDYAYVHNALGVTVNFATQGLEAVFGGFFDDVLDASGMATTAYLLGNTGIDQLTGGAADDIVWFDHQDTVVQGGAGYNFAYAYNVGTNAVTVNLLAQNFDTAWGGFGNDTLNAAGKLSGVVLVGLGGDDTMTGSDSVDTLSAGDGNDLIKGGGGNDTIFGEGGTADIAVYDGLAGDYTVTNIAPQIYTVTHNVPSGATDTIYNVEFLRFLGGGADMPLP